MMPKWLITLLVGLVVYEIIEHLLLPLFLMVRPRKRKSPCDPGGMIGRKCVVRQWCGASKA